MSSRLFLPGHVSPYSLRSIRLFSGPPSMDLRKRTLDTSLIEQLPDDILICILSLLPIHEIVRTSILSRMWRNIWRHITCLDFDPTNVLPVQLSKNGPAWRYVAWVNKVIHERSAIPGLPLVKDFRIRFGLDATQSCHIDRWISYAIENQVERLHLDFGPYMNNICPQDQYKLSEESCHKAASGLSSLKSLKSLVLNNVNVSKQFIEFILSGCPLLEDLTLTNSGCYSNLNVSGVPALRLKRLNIRLIDDFVLAILDAPYLTSLTYCSGEFHPQKIDVPMLTDLSIGGPSCKQSVMDYLGPFWSYLPRLEKLELTMREAKSFRLEKMPELVSLKYLKIRLYFGSVDPSFCEILNFINACPLLEVFALEIPYLQNNADAAIRSFSFDYYLRMFQVGATKHPFDKLWVKRRKRQEYPGYGTFKCLKVLELHGAREETIDQEVLKFIIRSGSCCHLKKLIVDSRPSNNKPYLQLQPPNLEYMKALEAKAKELCRWCLSGIEIIVIG